MRLRAEAATLGAMTHDRFAKQNWCRYCSRPAVVTWAPDIRTCTQEVCQELAFALVSARDRRVHAADPGWPCVNALLRAERTLERALALDLDEELLTPPAYDEIRNAERQRTAATIAAVRRLAPRPARTAAAAVPRAIEVPAPPSAEVPVPRTDEAEAVPRDLFAKLDRCRYCDRRATIVWDGDVRTCGREVCESLAFAELRRRSRATHPHAA
jgi:hypothetical protein